jgi:hypothetical protein
MSRLVGKVVLRNPYRVLLDSVGDYEVSYKDPRGCEYSQDVAAKVVRYVQKKCRGKTVAVAEAQTLLEGAPKGLPVPYAYGFKLRYYAQAVLVVLVATRQARYKKCGQRFEYEILALGAAPEGRRRPSGRPAGRAKRLR